MLKDYFGDDELENLKLNGRKNFVKARRLAKSLKDKKIGNPEQFNWVKKYGR